MNSNMKLIDSTNLNDQKLGVCVEARMLTSQERIFTSSDLLGESNSALIDHRGAIYTLRLTQFGKLILTK